MANEWNGSVWIKDNWTDEEKTQALSILSSAEAKSAVTTQEQIEKQQQAFDQFRRNAGTNWNVFYEQNQNKFFKDRHYLHKAFPLEFAWLYPHDDINENDGSVQDYSNESTCDDGAVNSCTNQQSLDHWSKSDEVHVVEIGCGVGNAILPLLEQHSGLMQHKKDSDNLPHLHVHCLDFAPNAIKILKDDIRFRAAANEGRATAHVYDLSAMHPSMISIGKQKGLANSADVAILLFCLSAVGPHPSTALSRAANHAMDMLKPGGILIIRDYGRLDEAQLKLGKGNKGLGENFYQKGDGTGVYYFELNDLKALFGNDTGSGYCGDKLEILELDYIQRVYRNRGDGTTRRRVWVQGRFQKPFPSSKRTSDRDESLLMQEFMSTSTQRWDNYYKIQPDSLQQMSLGEAISLKNSNNLLQIFPIEFGQWKSLLDPLNATKRKICATNGESIKAESLSESSNVTVIDVGCGVGSGTLLNIMAKQQMQAQLEEFELPLQPRLRTHYVDVSFEAIQRLQNDPRYKSVESGVNDVTTEAPVITSTVADITTSQWPPTYFKDLSSADFVLLLFSLSAMGPYKQQNSMLRNAVKNVASMLKPGGVVLFRDFGRYDDDQLQLNSCFGSQICSNFYFKDGDASGEQAMGTAVYFFDLEEVRELFVNAGFEVLQLEYINRPYSKSGKQSKNLTVNGGAIKRTRVWVHGRFRKPSNIM
jgi:SAM-dependent methyltransferase